jgi:hypothetical protein
LDLVSIAAAISIPGLKSVLRAVFCLQFLYACFGELVEYDVKIYRIGCLAGAILEAILLTVLIAILLAILGPGHRPCGTEAQDK